MANTKKPSLHRQSSNKGSLYPNNKSSFQRNNGRNNSGNNSGRNRTNKGNSVDYQTLLLRVLSAIVAIILSILSIIAQGISFIFREMKKNPKMARNVIGILVIILVYSL